MDLVIAFPGRRPFQGDGQLSAAASRRPAGGAVLVAR